MKHHFAILNSNEVTLDGTSFDLEALAESLWQAAVVGIPSNLGHDAHRPTGWVRPYGLYLEPQLVRTVGELLLPDSAADSQWIADAHERAFYNRQQHMGAPFEVPLTALLKPYVTEARRYLYCEAFACVEPGLVQQVFPELTQNLDNKGLVYLADILKSFTYLGQGVFGHKRQPLTVFAHPYFRRSLSRRNNFHFLFLDELLSHAENPHVRIRLRLDADMVGYAPSVQTQLEYEYWRGPKYDDEIGAITPGLTHHHSSEFERMYYGVAATEFIWEAKEEGDGKPRSKPRRLHEFEMEEVKDTEVPGTESFGCRYMHAFYDKDAGTFEHFDGAIRMYDWELMAERVGTPMNEFGHRSDYTKLFRIDDPLRLDENQSGPGLALRDWKSLVTKYMQGNPQVYEYFGEKKPGVTHLLEEVPHSVREELVPYSMQAGDSVRLLASFHALSTPTIEERVVTGRDGVTDVHGRQRAVLEYDVIEVRKALRALGTDLTIPTDVGFIYAEDGYWNIPTIFHGGQAPQEALALTIQALRNLLQAAHARGTDQVISFTLAWAMEDKEVRVSALGHVADLAAWLRQVADIPTQRSDFIKWLKQQETYLDAHVGTVADWPELEHIVKSDGVLFIERRLVDRQQINNLGYVDHALRYELTLPASHQDWAEAFGRREIAAVAVWEAYRMNCSKTGGDYWVSPHSRLLEPDVRVIARDVKLAALCWTDKPSI